MPLLIHGNELQAGMRMAESFIWRDLVMVTGGTVLTESEAASLRARFPDHSFRIVDAQLDEAIEFEDDSYERQVAHTTQRRIADCMKEVQFRFSRNTSLTKVSQSTVQPAVVEVIKYLENHPVSAALVDSFVGGRGYLSERAGNVFFLSMLLGTAAYDYVSAERERQSSARSGGRKTIRDLVPLGLGAVFIDLGMLPIQDLYSERKPLTPEIWAKVRDHPVVGAEMLPDDIFPATKAIVRTHHENLDGSGYPAGIPGEKLHVFARIVRIADAFDAATATRVYREAKSPVRVMWEMTAGPYKPYYDPTLIKAFARLIQPFPIGSKIRLSNGRYAVVVRYNRESPLAPTVIVAFDQKNRRLINDELSPPVQLGEHPDLRATELNGEDLSFLYEEAPALPKSRVGIWPSLFEAAYP